MTRIKTYLATLIKEEKLNIFEIDEHLTQMSEALQVKLTPDFAEYGVALEKFFVTTIVKPEEDRAYQKFKDLHFRQYADIAEAKLRQQVEVIEQETEAKRMVIESQGLAQKRSIEGYSRNVALTWQKRWHKTKAWGNSPIWASAWAWYLASAVQLVVP